MKKRYRKARAAIYGVVCFLIFSVAAQAGSPVGAYETEAPISVIPVTAPAAEW